MTDLRRAVLIATKLKGFVQAADLAGIFALTPSAIEMVLEALESEGMVVSRLAGQKLSAAGAGQAAAIWAEDARFIGIRDLFRIAEDVEQLAPIFKPILSDWRMIKTKDGPTRNTHRDIAYDDALIDELFSACDQLKPILLDLGKVLPRCGFYKGRLENALKALEEADTRFVADDDVDSVAVIWFEVVGDVSNLKGAVSG
ncbi:MAG: hypothetical protein AAF337_08090 [Pseudomonadota bacterium]